MTPEYEALRRDHAAGMVELRRHLDALAVDTRLRFDQIADRMEALVETGERTDACIAPLVSAIGEHMRLGRPQK